MMDSERLLTIFPEEIWEKVLSEVQNADDQEACSNASTFFRERLSHKRVHFLFQKVIPIIAPILGVDSSNSLSWHQRTNRGLFKSLANCRLSCSSWNKAFETFCQASGPARFQMQRDSKEKSSIFKFVDQIKYNFDLRGPFPDEFLHHFEKTHSLKSKKNPFPGRAVSLRMFPLETNPPPRAQVYVTGIEAMLLKYGQEIWYCRLHVEDERTSITQFYFQLKEWLNLMPNLKALSVAFLNKCWSKLGSLNIFDLEQVTTAYPLSHLRQLERLDFGFIPAPICKQIIKQSHKTLSNLQICTKSGKMEYFEFICSVQMLNLKKLSIYMDSVNDFEKLEKFGGNWKLEIFHLFYSEKGPFIQWSRVFDLIENKWSATLTDLAIQLPMPNSVLELTQILEQSKSVKLLNLPHVKRLYLSLDIPCSLDFVIVPLKHSLEHLKIFCGYRERSQERKTYWRQTLSNGHNIIQLFGFENCLYKSNIWKLCRKLRVVKMRCCDQQGNVQKYDYARENVPSHLL